MMIISPATSPRPAPLRQRTRSLGFGTSSGAWAWRLGADRGSETFDPGAVTLVIHSMRITHVIIGGGPTMNIVCLFGDVCLDDIALVGGEGANAGELTIPGLSVSLVSP